MSAEHWERALPSLTHLHGRVAATAAVIVLVLGAGAWIALTHSQDARSASSPLAGSSPAPNPVGPLELLSLTPSANETGVSGTTAVQVQFSATLALDSPLPTITPNVAGTWQGAGTTTLRFVPASGLAQLTRFTISIPGGPLGVRSDHGSLLGSTVTSTFKTGTYQPARVVQLLAELGYLPLTWTPAPGATEPAAMDRNGQLAAAYDPPQGTFTWQSGYPSALHDFWQNGAPASLIVTGAIMAFESDHNLDMDGTIGPRVWTTLLEAIAAGQKDKHGYTYAVADEGNPETLTIWHDGKIVQQSQANTGIEAAPTTIGTAPVYLRYRNQIMRGTNPDGTKYADPVQYVAYFRSGEAVHYFPRGTYGWPQSLGCVELDLSDAAHAWPYLTYGSLVSVVRGSLTPPDSPTA